MYIIANAGDETTIEFDASTLTDPPEDWTRDFLIYTVGWVKDGDLNTARGQTVDKGKKQMWNWFDLAHEWIVRGFADLTTEKIQQNIWRRL